MTFSNENDFSAPTELIPINNCCTVKSADDELNIKNSFVSHRSFIVLTCFHLQKVLVSDRTFYFLGKDNGDKEGWIGALGKAMIKTTVMMDDNLEGAYM